MCRCTITFIVAGILATETLAAVPNKSSEDLRTEASHIVVGKVSRIYSSAEPIHDNLRRIRLVAEISVEKVEKGAGIAPGDTLYARYWNVEWLGDPKTIPPMDATTAIFPCPKAGDAVRVYLGLNQQNGLGKDSGRGFNVLFPNGFEIQRKNGKRDSLN